jgi:hypothetical protein
MKFDERNQKNCKKNPPFFISVGQTLSQLPWKQNRGDLKDFWIPFIKLHEIL